MTAYRSSNAYRQTLLRYDGEVVVNVTVTPAVIAGTSTAPAVTVTEGSGVTVTPAVIAATSTAPAVTVSEGTGVTVTPAVIATAATTPAVTVKINVWFQCQHNCRYGSTTRSHRYRGHGCHSQRCYRVWFWTHSRPDRYRRHRCHSCTPAAVAATVTVPDPTVTEGAGVSVAPSQVSGVSTLPPLSLSMRFVPTTENILPQVDVVPYHTNDPARRLARFRTPGARGRNIFILTSGAVTTRQPGDPATISRTLLGGHESPTDLTSEELDALVGAGFTVEVR